MEVLIVAKTHMKNAFCVGAYDIKNKKNVRLLTKDEDNQPLNTKFNIGQIWDIDYKNRSNIINPHVEDVLVQRCEFLENVENLSEFLTNNVPIWKGGPSCLFEGKINFPLGRTSGFLEKKNSDLTQSVGFWVSDNDLELTILDDKKHYLYFGVDQPYSFPFVGAMDRVETIPKGTILRVSLSRWWSPSNNLPRACYCQLSGWYDLK